MYDGISDILEDESHDCFIREIVDHFSDIDMVLWIVSAEFLYNLEHDDISHRISVRTIDENIYLKELRIKWFSVGCHLVNCIIFERISQK